MLTMFTVFIAFCPALLAAKRVRPFSEVLPQDLEESKLELNADLEVNKPAFDPVLFSSMLKPFLSLPPQPCGTRILNTVRINRTMTNEIINHFDDYFFMKKNNNGKKMLVAISKGWSRLAPQDRGKLPILDGHRAVDVPKDFSFKRSKSMLWMSVQTEFTFDVGVDMRSCWGDLHDLSNREVCSASVLKGLNRDMANIQPITDRTGQSGSTIVTNVDNFILKNLKDDAEYELLREVMNSFGNNIRDRWGGSCYNTGIAPMCLSIQLPSYQDDVDVHWVAMRKIEIPGEKRANVLLDGDIVKDLDLKGPKFANSVRDGKTYFGKAEIWKKKDKGFAKMFPHGLTLRGCGSRDVASTLELDAELLEKFSMTDYSLYGKFYSMPKDDAYDCVCSNSKHPTFPMILDVQPRHAPFLKPLRLAIGIIDYIERKVNGIDKLLGFSMSTMKKPREFHEWWMRMWPSYFHLPNRTMDKYLGLIHAADHAPAEQLKLGQRVGALMKIKWYGGDEDYRTSREYDGETFKAYNQQIPESSSETSSSGSKYKVVAGDEGTVMSFEDGFLYVQWDKYQNKNKVHGVFPEQIMGRPPKIVHVA